MMIRGLFRYFVHSDGPLVTSWLSALDDARVRTQSVLQGINPWDAIVLFLREKHNLLIGDPTANRILIEIGSAPPDQPRVLAVKGRNLITGQPDSIEITSLEVQAVDNSEVSLPYVRWSRENGSETIGEMLYSIAAHEANWLYVGVLQQDFPDEIRALFALNADEVPTFIRADTLGQHWKRLETVRGHLMNAYGDMTLEDFRRMRQGTERLCSAEWVAHELCQYEAERRSEIAALYAEARKALDSGVDE
jgi:hypothetical protein